MKNKAKTQVAIIMGSKNDYRIMQDAVLALKEFGVNFNAQVVSAHRTPKFMYDFAAQAAKKGIKIIIAGAGGAAHLPGMVASLTHLPVIGVPIVVGKLGGLDSLLSIAQMPKGVPVATVAVDNAYNAGLLAVRMLAQEDKKLASKLIEFNSRMRNKILKSKLPRR